MSIRKRRGCSSKEVGKYRDKAWIKRDDGGVLVALTLTWQERAHMQTEMEM